jgi:hypothetical protein
VPADEGPSRRQQPQSRGAGEQLQLSAHAPGAQAGEAVDGVGILEAILESLSARQLGGGGASAADEQRQQEVGQASSGGEEGGGAVEVARAALALLASLRERRRHALLLALLDREGEAAPLGGGGSLGLAQSLLQLAAAAVAPRSLDAAAMILSSQPWPSPLETPHAAVEGRGGGAQQAQRAQHEQLAWHGRVRLAQEALTLLRALLVDDVTGEAAWWSGWRAPARVGWGGWGGSGWRAPARVGWGGWGGGDKGDG